MFTWTRAAIAAAAVVTAVGGVLLYRKYSKGGTKGTKKSGAKGGKKGEKKKLEKVVAKVIAKSLVKNNKQAAATAAH